MQPIYSRNGVLCMCVCMLIYTTGIVVQKLTTRPVTTDSRCDRVRFEFLLTGVVREATHYRHLFKTSNINIPCFNTFLSRTFTKGPPNTSSARFKIVCFATIKKTTVLKTEGQKYKKFKKCATINTRYDVKKQDSQSEMKAIPIYHLSQSGTRWPEISGEEHSGRCWSVFYSVSL
jgi:hypothetical protein